MKDNIEDRIIGDKIREWEANAPSADNSRLWQRLEQRLEDVPEKKIKPVYYRWAAAAVLLFGMLGGWFAFRQPAQQPQTAAVTPAAALPGKAQPAINDTTRNSVTTIHKSITNIHKPEHAKHQRKMVVAKRSSRNAAPSVSVPETTPAAITATDLIPGFPGMLSTPITTAACYDDIKIQMPLCY